MQGGSMLISLATGTLLNGGRYRIVRELNRGGTAVVYAAEDHQSKQTVALKVMNGPDQVPIKVVKREITFSSSIHHENIVRLLDVFAEKHQLVIVWELIAGPDLLDLLNECGGRLPEEMAAFYFLQLLKAVMFMHENGFCHRDIKPENAMVIRETCQLKLIDFGLSKHLESANTLGVGTPDYMCPEMLQQQRSGGGMALHGSAASHSGTPPYDAKAVDAWAMGVLMYLLVTGKYPFEDPAHPNNLAHTIHNVLAGRVRPFPLVVSPGCEALIRGLLQIQPTSRTTLRGLVNDKWLKEQARSYGRKVGHEEYVASLAQYKAMHLAAPAGPPISGHSFSEHTAGGSNVAAAATHVAAAAASTGALGGVFKASHHTDLTGHGSGGAASVGRTMVGPGMGLQGHGGSAGVVGGLQGGGGFRQPVTMGGGGPPANQTVAVQKSRFEIPSYKGNTTNASAHTASSVSSGSEVAGAGMVVGGGSGYGHSGSGGGAYFGGAGADGGGGAAGVEVSKTKLALSKIGAMFKRKP